MSSNHSLARVLAQTVDAYHRCIRHGESHREWADRHLCTIRRLQTELPSGSGIDNGTTVDVDRSNSGRLVFHTSYHHMTEGYYDGWTEHTVIARADFAGIVVSVSGRDRNGIKDYLAETFDWSLSQPAPAEFQPVQPAGTES